MEQTLDTATGQTIDSKKLLLIVEDLLKRMGVPYSSATVTDTDPHPIIEIESEESRSLIGPQGEHLKALTYVAKNIAAKEFGPEGRHFLLDVNGYERKKLDELKSHARMLAERARAFKSEVPLSPMNSYERMIIHAQFSEDPEVETESAGEGKFRHIVLKPRQ